MRWSVGDSLITWLGDLLGRHRVLIVGLALCGLALLLVGMAQSEAWMIAARAFQGIGAASVVARAHHCAVAGQSRAYSRYRRIRHHRGCLGASLGLVVGGALTSAGH